MDQQSRQRQQNSSAYPQQNPVPQTQSLQHLIRFIGADGTIIQSRAYLTGQPVTVPRAPQTIRAHGVTYCFTGWSPIVIPTAQGSVDYYAMYVQGTVNKKRTLTIALSAVAAVLLVVALIFLVAGKISDFSSPTGQASVDRYEDDEDNNDDQDSNDGDLPVIAFVPKVVGQAWWDYVGDGVAQWAEENRDVAKVIYKGPSEVDAAAQVQIMTDLVDQGVDVLCFSPNDPNACLEICQKAREQGIIVIATESFGMSNEDYCVESFTDEDLGIFLMDELARQMAQEGEYITMVGSMTLASHNNWADAAVAHQRECYPNMKLVADARVSSQSDSEVAYNLTKQLIQKYPNLKGILGTSSFDAPGAARAIAELGLTGQVFVISVALPSETRDYLKSGVLQSVALWDPAVTAQAMLNLAVKMYYGEEVRPGMDLGLPGYESVRIEGNTIIGKGALAITADNVDKFTF